MSPLNVVRTSAGNGYTNRHSHEYVARPSDEQQRVAEYAYRLWLMEGCPEGKAFEHWVAAENAVAASQSPEQEQWSAAALQMQIRQAVRRHPRRRAS